MVIGSRSAQTAIEILSSHIVNTRFEDFEPINLFDAKNRLIDIIGCAIGGCNAPGNQALLDLIYSWGGSRGDSTIWIHGLKTSAQNAAMINSIMARSYDFEVMAGIVEDKVFTAHHSVSIIPTALALGEQKRVSGKELLTAVLVADDLNARVLVAGGGSPINIGWDGTMLFSNWGTTAAAGRLLGLDEKQMKHAFGIVLNMMAGSIQSLWDGATTFKMQGMADQNGILAAELARKGWTGIDDPLFGRFGFYNVYIKGCQDPDLLTRNLGKKFWGETYYKPYPGGMPNHVAIGAALEMLAKNDIEIDNIKEIIIYVPPTALTNSYYAKPFVLRDYPLGDAIFSYPYSVASTLLKKSVGLSNYTLEAIMDPQIRILTAKTRMVEQPVSVGGSNSTTGITLKVSMNDGQEFSESKGPVREWVTHPITRETIIKKYWHQVNFTNNVSPKNAERILETILNLENVEDVSLLIKLIA
jgi:2-methylcitrate dehydratase PrpD